MDKHIQRHFREVDPVLYSTLLVLLKESDTLVPAKTDDYFVDLCQSIVSQQLSEKAGATIWNRFTGLFPKKRITPQRVFVIPDEKIRAVGPSWSKISYLKNLAGHVVEKTLDLQKLPDMDDTDVIVELTKVKGIGPWTAEMFLMFALGRPDVFSFGDLGLKNAIKKMYKFTKDPTRKQMEKIAKKWTPYRTYACRILWKSLELK